MGAVTYPTLEHVAMEARPYPTHLLEGCETGLCLFAAAFLGHNDAVHMAEAGMRWVVCVDTDEERLAEMRPLYPEDWLFIENDAWAYAEVFAKEGNQWDAISVDTFTGDVMRRSLDSLELWCSLAKKVVTVTITSEAISERMDPPDGPRFTPRGWKSSLYERATGVYWLVLERNAGA